jgi:uncharacterized protein YndB with AHSA1/START domain
MSTDRIEKKVLLRAPRKRVWRALTDSTEFGTWFGVKFDGPFTPGASLREVVVPIQVNAFRWHPFAIERGVDYSAEPTTLVVFTLEDVAGGVMLTVTESGFDQIPLARRAKAFTANEQGWGMMVKPVEEYLARTP